MAVPGKMKLLVGKYFLFPWSFQLWGSISQTRNSTWAESNLDKKEIWQY
jgi:hypothetical protein